MVGAIFENIEKWKKFLSLDQAAMMFFGQAGFVFKDKDGFLVGVDLYFSDCVERVENSSTYRRLQPSFLSAKDLYLDYLIATHHHRDHFDYDSISDFLVNGKTVLLCPEDCREDCEMLYLNLDKVAYIHPGVIMENKKVKIKFLSCDHGKAAPLAVGVLIALDGKVVLITGDTSLRKDFLRDYLSFGPIDYLIAPINGHFGNLSEFECIDLALTLKAKVVVPCHYGMFEAHGGDIGIFTDLADRYVSDFSYRVMKIGEYAELV